MEQDKLITEKELREWLDISRTTIWRYKHKLYPPIPHHQPQANGTTYYDRQEVVDWIKETNKESVA